jgi:guanylate kinase
LLARDEHLWLSRSWTTRPQRPGEPHEAYHFVDRETFMRRVEDGGFLEWARVLDDLYGTPTPEPPPGCDVLLEIDIQGARQVLARHPDAVTILLLAPSIEAQRARLEARGDPPAHVQRRIDLGMREAREAQEIAAHVVVNDDLDSAVEQVSAIIAGARSGSSRA